MPARLRGHADRLVSRGCVLVLRYAYLTPAAAGRGRAGSGRPRVRDNMTHCDALVDAWTALHVRRMSAITDMPGLSVLGATISPIPAAGSTTLRIHKGGLISQAAFSRGHE